MIRISIFSILLLVGLSAEAQKYIADSSYVRFYSSAPVEDIAADNVEGQSAMNWETGEMVFVMPIRGFQFEEELMQEHFNENYMETEKYPKATLTGKILNWDQSYGAKKFKGEFSIHGVQQKVEIDGTLTQSKKGFNLDSKFFITLEDYKIKIPSALFYNIAEKVEVTVHFEYAAK
ncbi:YceI family protein [Reichenbachiella ulvae]|uniref:YceI family protein n=1 Tax=Reichenbachiella ulvae TaxID=2980104 RepID=A0ABT3CSK6_9BACT|nr:YceI family protein [Reichenbachiella ulvae]MCV9386566.1 YceI family protein [Reichenbachiella ulvae]